jgi:hypothetical protein
MAKTISEICSHNDRLIKLAGYLQNCCSLALKDNSLFKPLSLTNRKTDTEKPELFRQQSVIQRDYMQDRIFPLETTETQYFNIKNSSNIENPLIHYGPASDEFVRSLNALAVTIGRNIYFRNGAYKPESEEGRKTIAHELTHVQQYQENRITHNSLQKDLEAEAEKKEHKEEYTGDTIYKICFQNKLYSIQKKDIPTLSAAVSDRITQMVESEKNKLKEEDYLKLLCAYEAFLQGDKLI